ncbi:MAG: DUF455 family protein [Trueperaceae bacterium]|nr:DUF455 family protein [Trueperaceae bacterium]
MADFLDNAKLNIERLKFFQAFEIQLTRLLGGWLPGVERWETKHEIGLHIFQNAENSRDLRTRLWELRVSNPDKDVEAEVLKTTNALALAQHDFELLTGVYLVVKKQLIEAYQAYVKSTHGVYDYPSIPVLKRCIATNTEQLEWAKRELVLLTDSGEKKRKMQCWLRYTEELVRAIGGIDGQGEKSDLPMPPPAYSLLLPFSEAKRDERFKVQIMGMPMPEKSERLEWLLWQFANYAAEMQAAETLATVLWETEGMPWEFYFDIARHCWDEVRHSKLGETRLAELGYHVSDFPCSVGSYAWRQLFDPLIRYCALTYIIEAGSFKLKHESYQDYLVEGDTESAQAIMFDIVDETMHVRWGSKWVPELMKHYDYGQTLEHLIEACRDIVSSHSVAPAQRKAIEKELARA